MHALHTASCGATRQPPGGHRARGSPAPQGIQRTCYKAFSACVSGHLAPVPQGIYPTCHRAFSARATGHSAPVPQGIYRTCHRSCSARSTGHSAHVPQGIQRLCHASQERCQSPMRALPTEPHVGPRVNRQAGIEPGGRLRHRSARCHGAFSACATGH